MAKLILVTGGARSGKSDYALSRAETLGGKHYFLATCPVVDSEMDERIARHRADRQGRGWLTIEEEIHIEPTIMSLEPDSVCLVDCLTLWVNNLMYVAEKSNQKFGEDAMGDRVTDFIRAAEIFKGTLICVSNEVGMGVVPDNVLGRRYRDLVGRTNRLIAAAADEVILVSCGLPICIKNESTNHPIIIQ
ncbi:adenosyl cobinamide kinase/adenosyl cobinamide phosphate guanylyltransferase [Desulfocapsa sulfexigens DSM 10523]|uniref:Adenosylcobinamide kinase n=1 Tax=Desulfocapsa sulfexigens (strain DSM 10523 / SB164P1) TaxID=1167006 RepID=M1PD15_DESSD|nr:bifunctional adenosylcobinamide kinase/adenosylcobinamide-phosphate guanylyltransferase [Desulfocapsa sulfexigens]AGF79487.1 adenosyl cobinamide kinase/adenosyl cobinamide phosphate guanylyltransferase [Desulfocapsa sulfexigens DSM 10523]